MSDEQLEQQEQKMSPEERKANLKYNRYVEQLTALYDTAEALSEDVEPHLQEKIAVYGHILEVVGNLHTLAFSEFQRAQTAKIEAEAAAVLMIGDDVPAKVRDARVVMAIKPYRKRRDEFKGYAKRWENAYKSIHEQIQIMKYKLKDFNIEKAQGNQSRGGAR